MTENTKVNAIEDKTMSHIYIYIYITPLSKAFAVHVYNIHSRNCVLQDKTIILSIFLHMTNMRLKALSFPGVTLEPFFEDDLCPNSCLLPLALFI